MAPDVHSDARSPGRPGGRAEADSVLPRLLAAAERALAPHGVRRLQLTAGPQGGSTRSVLARAIGDRGPDPPLSVIIKMPLDPDAFRREHAGLSLASAHHLPGVVTLLATTDAPRALILEDLGDGPSVSDFLLGDDPDRAEQALVDWATTLAAMHAGTAGLQRAFAERLGPDAQGTTPMLNLTRRRLMALAMDIDGIASPHRVTPSQAAVDELNRAAAAPEPLGTSAPGGLVPGDCCPDNNVYVDGVLRLIDFEATSFRPAAWDAAYLAVPWPTCWCAWALPAEVSARALNAWRSSAAAHGAPEPLRDEDLAAATVLWSLLSSTAWLRYVRAERTDPARVRAATGEPSPTVRALALHRLHVAASLETPVLPALRELAGQLHRALEREWGAEPLQPAPAFRVPTASRPAASPD